LSVRPKAPKQITDKRRVLYISIRATAAGLLSVKPKAHKQIQINAV